LLVECSVKHETQLFVSARHLYPYEHEFKWAFGDLSEDLIEKIKSNASMRDILTEASPFEIAEDGSITYLSSFKRPDLYKPEYAHLENEDKMRDLTTLGAASIAKD
jgi:hypothetical protein